MAVLSQGVDLQRRRATSASPFPGERMPIVNILVTREGTRPGAEITTREQKAALYKGIADLLFTVMGKPHEDTTVIFHEHEIDDLGQGGLPLSDYRNQRTQNRQVNP
jgi:4-oxalocrotonate tautomerase